MKSAAKSIMDTASTPTPNMGINIFAKALMDYPTLRDLYKRKSEALLEFNADRNNKIVSSGDANFMDEISIKDRLTKYEYHPAML